MKRKVCLLGIIIGFFCIANLNAQEEKKPNLWKISGSLAAQVTPPTENGVVAVVPFASGSFSYSIPIHLSDNILFTGSRLGISISPSLTPMSFSNQFSFSFVPTPILTFRLGCNFTTGWPIFGMGSSGIYDEDTDTYSTIPPFVAWKWDLSAGANFMFDWGIFNPNPWTHILTTGSYSITYSRFLNAKDGEKWQFMGQENQEHGFKHSVSAMVGYMIPYKGSLVAVQGSWSSPLLASDEGKFSLSVTGSMTLDEKNSLTLSSSFPSFTFTGIMVAWAHTFK